MNTIDIARRSLRNLNQAKMRTFLTSCAIGIGAFALAITLSLGTSLNNLTEKLLFSGQDRTTLTVMAKLLDAPSRAKSDEPEEYKEDQGPGGVRGFIGLTQNQLDQLEQVEGVEKVNRPYWQGVKALYLTGPSGKKYTISAHDLSQPEPAILTGSFDQLGTDGIAITEPYVKVLGFSNNDESLGKTVTFAWADSQDIIQTKTFTVKGVVAKPSSLFSFFSQDAAYFSDQELKGLYDLSQAGKTDYGSFFSVTVEASSDATDAELAALRDRINDLYDGKVFQASTRADSATEQAGFVRNIQYALAGFAGVVLLAALFGIINTQLMSVFQRTREIGLMKALGMSRGGVTQLFLFEAMFIGLFGALLGIGLAYLGARLVDPWIVRQLDNVGVSGRFLIFDPLQLLMLCVGLMIIAAMAGVFPARKAAKLDPVEALRVE